MELTKYSLSALLALLLCSLAAGQVSQSAPAASPQLRFVAQLSVSGCALFVHDTGASDGPHLAIEPIMCVTDSLQGLFPRLDPVTQQLYVSVPVVMRDAGMLAEAQRQLRHLSPRSVSFATVTNISVSANINSSIRIVGFLWSPEESVANIRLEYNATSSFTTHCNCSEPQKTLSVIRSTVATESKLRGMIGIRKFSQDVLHQIWFSASVMSNSTCSEVRGRIVQKSDSSFDVKMNREKYESLTFCQQLRFIRSVKLENCTARVHQRLDVKGHFLIEPLLCHNITSLSSESVKYDYSRDMHYLKLDLVLHDDATLDAVRTQLADLSPRSVEFMRLWLAERSVSSALSARFEIGPLMVSADWRSAQMRLFCGTPRRCFSLRSSIPIEPQMLWQHVKWFLTSSIHSLLHACEWKSRIPTVSWRMANLKRLPGNLHCPRKDLINDLCSGVLPSSCKYYRRLSDGREFIKIQQRERGTVHFGRNWKAYENGFDNSTDFWIGLSAIHSLSSGGATLRVEMKLWNGTELHAEYAGFQVVGASTYYVMTYREMLRDRSSVGFDALEHNKGMRFSTMDRDNDGASGSCSQSWGKGGWWFNSCHYVNPNGIFPTQENPDAAYMTWHSGSARLSLREVRLMLQI